MMDLEFSGRRAVVTGGARGIGRRIAERLLSEGAEVAFCARDAAAAERTASELGQVGRARGWACDMNDGPATRAWLDEAADWLGGCDLFVHNASAGGGGGEEQWRRNFEVDLMGAVRGMEQLAPRLEERGGAAVFIVSVAALEAFPFVQPYNALKASLIVYAKQLSQQLAPKGVRLNCVSPGSTLYPGSSWERHKTERPAYYESVISSMPSGRLGQIDEIVDPVLFLLSPRASWITGINVIVDGGQTKRVSL